MVKLLNVDLNTESIYNINNDFQNVKLSDFDDK